MTTSTHNNPDEGCLYGGLVIILTMALAIILFLSFTGCSNRYSAKYGYQKDPFYPYVKHKKKEKNPKMIQLYPMSYYAQTPNP